MSDRPAVRVWEAAAATSWAILPERLPAIFEIAAREHDTDLAAVAARLGRPLDNARAATRRDGVMVIPIEGVIFPRASLFTAISGGVSTSDIALDLGAALDDPAIHSIVLVTDSPGGDINGVGELAAMVREATRTKRVVAYVRALGASAAYWIIAAADEIVAAPTAMLGSIGIVQTVGAGGRVGGGIEFVSSQSPHKRISPTSGGGVARIQQRIDAIADVFIGDVARYRGIAPEKVVADFGGGDVLVGQAAVDAGLADRLGSFEGVIADLQARAREPRRLAPIGRVAAQSTGGIMAQEQPKQPGFWSKFWGHLGAQMDADESFTPAAVASQGPGFAPNAGIPRTPPQPDPQVAALQAELERLRSAEATRARESIAADAATFAEGEIRANRATPAEREALVAAFTDAATDDLDHPRAEGQPTRVAALRERQGQRPAHTLTTPLVPLRQNADGTLTAIQGEGETRTEGAEPQWTPERWRDLRSNTLTGKRQLARLGIPEAGPLSAEQRAIIAREAGVALTA